MCFFLNQSKMLIEETTVRSIILRYESGSHRPTFEMMCPFAHVINMPECYFYTIEDDFAEIMLKLHNGSVEGIIWILDLSMY